MDFTKGDLANPSLSNNHSGFLCHVTFYIYLKYTIGDIYPLFGAFYLRVSSILKWKTLLRHKNFPKSTLVEKSLWRPYLSLFYKI